jgi:hypothetical protein
VLLTVVALLVAGGVLIVPIAAGPVARSNNVPERGFVAILMAIAIKVMPRH